MSDAEITPSQLEPSLPGIAIIGQLRPLKCEGVSCQEHHPNIHTYSAAINLTGTSGKIGHVKLHTLNKIAMGSAGTSQMMQECQAYDEMHLGAQIQKIENFVENESFAEKKDVLLAEAQMLVYVEEVWLIEKFRGHRRGLAAVAQALMSVQVPMKSVVLLQAGSTDSSDFDPFETEDKLTRQWARMGFEPWSDSDTAWLCLSLKDETYGLAALQRQNLSKR